MLGSIKLTVMASGAILFGMSATTVAQPNTRHTPEEGRAFTAEAARKARDAVNELTFEEFKKQVPYIAQIEKYIVNGDTPIRNEKLLKEFFLQQIKNPRTCPSGEVCEFTVATTGGLDQIWNSSLKHRLTYCVSTSFGPNYHDVVASMDDAASALEAVADINFIHRPNEDDGCNETNNNVIFDVRPVDVSGQFLAAAFFPNEPRAARSIVIDQSAFKLDPNRSLTLTGVLRHELGHSVGGRHEHTRPEAGACFEDADWRGVTNYDALSFMHYPHCNGLGDFSLTLTTFDQNGLACLYGAAPGFTIDTSICKPSMHPSEKVLTFGPNKVTDGELVSIGSFSVLPGTPFVAEMSGLGADEGDPDLYVKFGVPASEASFDCRPFEVGAAETCSVIVPADRTQAHVVVHGYEAGNYQLIVRHVSP